MPASSTIIKMAKSGVPSPAARLGWWLALLVCLLAICQGGRGQTPPESKRQDQSEILRVYTDLVQTDVMVFDRQGKFVNGLKREDFELRIDGKPKPIEFFEKITAGSVSEESQLAAARGSSNRANPSNPAGPVPLDRGRPVFFYIDDLHLDLTGLTTTRKLVARFIDKEMRQNDEAAIASASGQIGFLQQLTDNKTVLHAALERLKLRPYSVRDFTHPAMTEYQALLVANYDRDITGYFIDATMRENPGITRDTAEAMVNSRAGSLLQQAGYVTGNTLSGLEGLIRSANKLPGRKLVFFISGGFFLDYRNSDSVQRLQRITSAAARSGVVIYSMDARGLVASLTDASSDSQFDPSGRLQRAAGSEISASQDSLNALAHDTGGKAIFNTNSMEPGLGRALKETSTYYLLAWKPEHETQKASRFRRLEVKVVGKPELTVQVRRGFFDVEPEPPLAKAKKTKEPDTQNKPAEKSPEKSSESELRKAMLTPYPKRDIPISLNLSYFNTVAKGPMLWVAMQMPNEFFTFVPAEGRQTAVASVAGTVFNDRGMAGAGFDNKIAMDAPSIEAARQGQELTYGYSVYLQPGLYQVRVGARDEKTGRSGSAYGWIEIPNLGSGELALSSLLVGVRPQPTISNASAATVNIPDTAEFSITHNFPTNGYLRFLVFVYNASLAPADSKPDVALQVQIVRDDQPVVTTVLKKVSTDGLPDFVRIAYAAEVPLAKLPSGRYLLKVSVVDRVSKRSASQQTRFDID